jgi:hypothetical protein
MSATSPTTDRPARRPDDPATADPRPNDLIPEEELREVLEPRVIDELIDYQRHHQTQEGTRYWECSECEDLLGAIEAWKGVWR